MACVSDKALLTLLSGGGGGKSSTSILAALLLQKLFSQQHQGVNYADRESYRENTNVIKRQNRRVDRQYFQMNLAPKNVSIDHKLGNCGSARLILTSESVPESPTTLVIILYVTQSQQHFVSRGAWLCCGHGLVRFVSTSESEPKLIQTNEWVNENKRSSYGAPGDC